MAHILWIWTRRFLMIIVPLSLAALECDHPSGFSQNVYDALAPMASHWKLLHIYQSFLFGAMALSAYILTEKINNFWGILSKIFIWIFVVSYLVFDSTAGVSVGFIIETYQQNPDLDLPTIKKLVQLLYNDPLIGGTNSFFSLVGSWSWLLGIGAAMITIYFDNLLVPRWKLLPPLVLLGISAFALYVGHYSPYGPIAFTSFALAALWFEIFHFGPAKELIE